MPGKILLIEDDDRMRSLISAYLELEGFTVISYDGSFSEPEMIQIINKKNPDLVLLDVYIHGKTSFDLLKKIKQQGVNLAPPVLMTSGMALDFESDSFGADGFILKPYMPADLVKKINSILEKE